MAQMTCLLCGRRQVFGLISSMSWGKAGSGDPCACPECVSKHPDWQQRIERPSSD